MVYISQLVQFSCICNTVFNFNKRNLCSCITEKLLHQGFQYHQAFTKFFNRYMYKEFTLKYTCRYTFKWLICAGIFHLLFYSNILHKERKAWYLPNNLTKPLNRLIHKGYSYDIVVKSLRKAYFGIYIDSFIGSFLPVFYWFLGVVNCVIFFLMWPDFKGGGLWSFQTTLNPTIFCTRWGCCLFTYSLYIPNGFEILYFP